MRFQRAVVPNDIIFPTHEGIIARGSRVGKQSGRREAKVHCSILGRAYHPSEAEKPSQTAG